ncbi:hypothetical protein [Roseomonas elaeocarpi]|uniref:Uncharacterized protein n=1 Tax=Roseomonas elaeocarpi TaxID=907779 RepID=A0ABV6JZ69_9PROT
MLLAQHVAFSPIIYPPSHDVIQAAAKRHLPTKQAMEGATTQAHHDLLMAVQRRTSQTDTLSRYIIFAD